MAKLDHKPTRSMMKSQFDMLLSVALELLYEAQGACGYQEKERKRDESRLLVASKSMGIEFFTLSLPSLDGILLQGLETGTLSPSGPLSRVRSKDDHRPRFLWGLWSLIFDSTGSLNEDADPNAILFLRQILCLGKKLQVACSDGRVKSALENYHAIESRIIPPLLSWGSDDLGDDVGDLSFVYSFDLHDPFPLFGECFDRDPHQVMDILRVLDFTSSALVASLGTFNSLSGEQTIQDGKFRHGPGAVADLKSSMFKYEFPNWPQKLDKVFPYDWCGSHTLVPETYPSEHEPASVLHAVPKTAKAPRLIASEPVAHQWCQQKVASWLVGAINNSIAGKFIDLKDQTLSQEMVKEASITGDMATLDLSDASDRLSCRHIESLLRGNRPLLEACHAVRTRWLVDRVRNDHPTNFLLLKKFAAQGSALTFPMQSLFFLACCLAACGARSFQDINCLVGKVRVYGDDLIVPTYAYARLQVLLTHLGLKVNASKSFSRGKFRESCGMDCWSGYDVTPLKPKTLVADAPERCQAVIDTSNNFYLRGFWRVSAHLDSTVLGEFSLPITTIDSGVPSLKSFTGANVSKQFLRWNGKLQRMEVRMHALMKGVKRIRQDRSATLLQYFTEAPGPDVYWSSGVARERKARFALRWEDLCLLSPLNADSVLEQVKGLGELYRSKGR